MEINATDANKHHLWFVYFSRSYDYLIVLICFMGLVGNALSVAVYSRKSFRCYPVNLLLAALSISDLCLLVIFIITYSAYPLILISDTFSVYFRLYAYPTSQIFHSCSVWLLAAITVERYLAVCKPLLVSTICTKRRTVMALAAIGIASLFYNSVKFWEYRIVYSRKYGRLVAFPLLRKKKAYSIWYVNGSSMLLIYLLPLLAMTVFNSRVVIEMSRSRKMHRQLTGTQRKDHRTARMLFYVVICFICCYTLSFVLNLIEVIHAPFFRTEAGLALNEINNALVVLNAATTFLFYLRFSSRYRIAAKRTVAPCLLRGVRAPAVRNRSNSTMSANFFTAHAGSFYQSVDEERNAPNQRSLRLFKTQADYRSLSSLHKFSLGVGPGNLRSAAAL